MKKLFRKIKHWYWWRFKATSEEKAEFEMLVYGAGIIVGGKHVSVKEIYKK